MQFELDTTSAISKKVKKVPFGPNSWLNILKSNHLLTVSSIYDILVSMGYIMLVYAHLNILRYGTAHR